MYYKLRSTQSEDQRLFDWGDLLESFEVGALVIFYRE